MAVHLPQKGPGALGRDQFTRGRHREGAPGHGAHGVAAEPADRGVVLRFVTAQLERRETPFVIRSGISCGRRAGAPVPQSRRQKVFVPVSKSGRLTGNCQLAETRDVASVLAVRKLFTRRPADSIDDTSLVVVDRGDAERGELPDEPPSRLA